MLLPKKVQKRLEEWLKYDDSTKIELQKLLETNNEKELIDRFYKELEFGTGGLRGVMGMGTNRMNTYTVGGVAQGIANYIAKEVEDIGGCMVVIAYDSRHNSREFALRSAQIFASNGLKVYVFNELTPTPILSYAIRDLGAHAGVMVTASHNPPEYNGYKVYYSDGAQVLPPHDIGIIEEVKKIRRLDDIKVLSEEACRERGLIEYLDLGYNAGYYKKVWSMSLNKEMIKEVLDNDVVVVFTPLHGASNIAMQETLRGFGVRNLHVVKEQEQPDGDFPTVEYPNPEEGAALSMGIALGKEKGADIVLASDPDGDRLGVALNAGEGDFKLLNGNQFGIICVYYILSEQKRKGELKSNGLILKTVVTTPMIDTICQDFGIHVEDVLTGFKYISKRVYEYHDIGKKEEREFIFGFEESYGYNFGDFVRDKDSIMAGLLAVEITAYCKKRGETLLNYLDKIYKRYGYYFESQKSITLKGKEGVEKINKIMSVFRGEPPKMLIDCELIKIRDIKSSKLVDLRMGEEMEIRLPKSNVLSFYYDNGLELTLRPSGTEPKLKFYFSYKMKGEDLECVKREVEEKIREYSAGIMRLVNGLLNKIK